MNGKWYLARPGGAAVGPLRTDVLVHRIREGTVSHEALVWCQGMEKWVPFGAVQELAGAVRDVSPQRPSPAAHLSTQVSPAGAPTRLAYKEDDADEKTELALPASLPAVPPSSDATVVLLTRSSFAQVTLAIPPQGPANAYSESWAWEAAQGSAARDAPDSVTRIVNPGNAAGRLAGHAPGPPGHAGGNAPGPPRLMVTPVLKTLPAAGVPMTVVPTLASARTGALVPSNRESAPTRVSALNRPMASASVAAAYPAVSPDESARGDALPPPYPVGYPGPVEFRAAPRLPAPNPGGLGVSPNVPGGIPPGPPGAAPEDPDAVELPVANSNVGTRLAVAVVFILGLALGIFGARRVVMMRQAAQDDKAADPAR